MNTLANKMMCVYYAIKFQFAFLIKKIRMQPFMRKNPDFAFMFSSEADKRLRHYIDNTDVRLKRLAASMMLESYMETLKISLDEQLSMVELQYLSTLISQIKTELKIV